MPSMTSASRMTTACVLFTIVVGASTLALKWSFLVPIFQSPDEHQHLDYALALRDGHRLFKAVPLEAGREVFAHPWSEYLVERAQLRTIAFNPAAKMPPEYGTRLGYERLDREAPPLAEIRIERPSPLAVVYPYGYYLTLAAWLKVVGLFSNRLSVTFFAARISSVILLAMSLLVGYRTARDLKIPRATALAATAIVGFFPMTTFVASYVQADNLSLFLVMLGLHLSLKTGTGGGRRRDVALLGLVWGWLLVTKPHFFACLVAASFPYLMTRIAPRRWAVSLALLTIPAIFFWCGFLWIVGECPSYYSQPRPMADPVVGTIQRLNRAFEDYSRGTTHLTFWGIFGYIDAPLELATPPRLILILRFAAMAGTWIVVALFLLRGERIATRIARAWRHGRPRAACRLMFSNPMMNMLALYWVLMIYAYVRMDNRFGAQGRNWLPVLFPIVLGAIHYAPSALTSRRTGKAVSVALTMSFLLYVALGSVYGLKTIKQRYYLPTVRWDLRDTMLATAPQASHAIRWEGHVGTTTAPGAIFRYDLAATEPVESLEVLLRVKNPAIQTQKLARTPIQISWGRRGSANAAGGSCDFHLLADQDEHLLNIPVQSRIDHIQIGIAAHPCVVEPRSVKIRRIEKLVVGPSAH